MRVAQLFLAAAGIAAIVAASGPARAEDDEDRGGWDEGARHHEFHDQLRVERAQRHAWREHDEGQRYYAAPPAYYAAPPVYYAPPPVYYAPRREIYQSPGFSIGFAFR